MLLLLLQFDYIPENIVHKQLQYITCNILLDIMVIHFGINSNPPEFNIIYQHYPIETNKAEIINNIIRDTNHEYIIVNSLTHVITPKIIDRINLDIQEKNDFIYHHSGIQISYIPIDSLQCGLNIDKLSKINQRNNFHVFSFTISKKRFLNFGGLCSKMTSNYYINFELIYRINRLGYKMSKLDFPLYAIENLNVPKENLSNDIRIYQHNSKLNYLNILKEYNLKKKVSMVTIGQKGRLANQLFQYATLYTISKMIDRDIIIYNLESKNEYKKFQLTIFPNISYLTLKEKTTFATISEKSFAYNTDFFNRILKLKDIPNCINIDGFFQSYLYFEKNKDDIKTMFTLSLKNQEYINQLFSKIKTDKPIVSIHIRRGDYFKFPKLHFVLPITYYHKAIKLFPNSYFYIFSDDIPWCKKNLGLHQSVYYSENQKNYIDLFLMSKCHHNIIANSSFSWWGGYLNSNPNKKVVYPSRWFAPTGPSKHNLIPPNWIKLDI